MTATTSATTAASVATVATTATAASAASFASEQGVETNRKLSKTTTTAVVKKTFKRVEKIQKPFLGIETKTPWGVVLKPIPRGRSAETESQVETTTSQVLELAEIRSSEPQQAAYKRVTTSEVKAEQKQLPKPEPKPEPKPKPVPKLPIICIEEEVCCLLCILDPNSQKCPADFLPLCLIQFRLWINIGNHSIIHPWWLPYQCLLLLSTVSIPRRLFRVSTRGRNPRVV